jgi:ABC-type antimicrobial peptide transport system permease subunit
MVLTEVGVLTVLGLAASVGTWAATSFFLRELMGTTWFSIPIDMRTGDYATVAAPVLVFVLCAAMPGIRGLMRLNLAAVLRGRAMG